MCILLKCMSVVENLQLSSSVHICVDKNSDNISGINLCLSGKLVLAGLLKNCNLELKWLHQYIQPLSFHSGKKYKS